MNPPKNKPQSITGSKKAITALSGMKILIGTPIHVCKDYAMERWIQNVSKLQKKSLVDVLLVDNSPDLDYVEKVDGYCKKYRVKNYRIEHFEIDQGLGEDIRIEKAEEVIRREVLSKNYDAWFSWECDQIIPTDALDKLVSMMEGGNFMMVNHNSWARAMPGGLNSEMGCSLIKKECFENNWFLPDRNGEISHDLSDRWQGEDAWFKNRVLKKGGNYIDVYGIIEPIEHLNE